MDNKQDTFNYTYSSKQQEEIKKIRNKYVVQEEDKIQQLRRLDKNVTSIATKRALIIGVIGALIMGLGMSLAMTKLGISLGLNIGMTMLIGILIGVTGIVLVSLAYPVYNRTLRREREKIAPHIISLTDELLK